MIPVPLSDNQKGTTSSGESTDPDPVPTPTTKVPSTPVLPSVDCTLRKRQRIEKAPQQIPLRTDEDSADLILQDSKRAYYVSGTAYFEEARRYYARLNEDIKKYDERMVLDSMYTSMNSETEQDYIDANDRAPIECILPV